VISTGALIGMLEVMNPDEPAEHIIQPTGRPIEVKGIICSSLPSPLDLFGDTHGMMCTVTASSFVDDVTADKSSSPLQYQVIDQQPSRQTKESQGMHIFRTSRFSCPCSLPASQRVFYGMETS
jgi:hypothetical protein